MRIKITPENDMEKQRMREVVHTGVKDFFIMGNKENNEIFEDFSDWKGSYRFLIGSLYYFLNQITEEQNAKARDKNTPEIDIQPDIQPAANFNPPMIKTGEVNDIKIINTTPIDVTLNNQEIPTKEQVYDEFTPQRTPTLNESQPEDWK